MSTKIKKIINKILVSLLIIGILSSAFGAATIIQVSSKEVAANANGAKAGSSNEKIDTTVPGGDGLNNEATLKDGVKIISEQDAKTFNNAIETCSLSTKNFQNGNCFELKLKHSDSEVIKNLSYGDIIVLEGDETTVFGQTQILKINYCYTDNEYTYIETSQPKFDEVFDEIKINYSEALTKDNFIDSATAEGVSMHFGDVDKEIVNTSSSDTDTTVSKLTDNTDASVVPLNGVDLQIGGGDMIFNINYELASDDKDKELGENLEIEGYYNVSLNGSFGLRDLKANIICDKDSVVDMNELYFGLSGETFSNISFESNVGVNVQPQASEVELVDNFLLDVEVEGLNEKLIPLGIWQFAGTSLIKVSEKAYKNLRLAPSIFVMLYADWEGNIELGFTASIEYSNAFNSGLRVIDDGEVVMRMENHPYTPDGKVCDKEDIKWSTKLYLKAESDLTLFGGSVLFCLAGVNICELSVINFGIEAEVEGSVVAGSEYEKPVGDVVGYARMYLKFIDVSARLSIDVETVWDEWGYEGEFEFCLLDFTLFELGDPTPQYEKNFPTSSIIYPTDFTSVISLVIDVSGSMSSYMSDSNYTKLEAAKQAALSLLQQMRNWNDMYEGNYGVGIVQFGSQAETVAFPHIDYDFLEECVPLLGDGGGTDIGKGLKNGISELENVESENKTIILLSDGQDGGSTAREMAEKAKGKNIKVYTIGFGNDIDEELLKEIAQITGGEYQYANTSSITSIMRSFSTAQHDSEGDVLVTTEGAIAEGETVTVGEFDVPEKSGILNGSVGYPGSYLETILIDPNGRIVDEDYPGASLNLESIPSSIVVKNPLAGNWKMKVKGIETSYEKEPYYAIASFKETNSEKITNNKLSTIQLVGAYALPIGIFMIIIPAAFLIYFNKKKNEQIDV